MISYESPNDYALTAENITALLAAAALARQSAVATNDCLPPAGELWSSEHMFASPSHSRTGWLREAECGAMSGFKDDRPVALHGVALAVRTIRGRVEQGHALSTLRDTTTRYFPRTAATGAARLDVTDVTRYGRDATTQSLVLQLARHTPPSVQPKIFTQTLAIKSGGEEVEHGMSVTMGGATVKADTSGLDLVGPHMTPCQNVFRPKLPVDQHITPDAWLRLVRDGILPSDLLGMPR